MNTAKLLLLLVTMFSLTACVAIHPATPDQIAIPLASGEYTGFELDAGGRQVVGKGRVGGVVVGGLANHWQPL